jgi:SPP1 family predicted phage head-tail adaptor
MSGPMRGGTLTRFIDIQQQTVTKDSFGGQALTWVTLKSVYAAIEALSASERMAAMSYSTDVSHRVTVRYDAIFIDPRVVATYRILYGARIFNIEGAMNVDEANRTIELICSEGLNLG